LRWAARAPTKQSKVIRLSAAPDAIWVRVSMTKASRRSLSHAAAVAVVLASGLSTVMTARANDVGTQESPATPQATPAAQDQQAAPAAPEQLGRIQIEYVPPTKPALQKTYQEVKNRRVLERTKEIFSPFRLSEDLYIKAVECDGKPNTYFDHEDDRPTVKICYQYLKAIHDKMPKKPTKAGITPREVMVGQFVFAAAHELGHALFEIYNIPIFGRQEDAADQFATYYILQFGGERARRLILGAAYAYTGFVKQLTGNPKVTLPLAAFSSDHGQPEQRFYNLVCIAYGYDPKLFAGAVDKKWLPSTRAKVCNLEYGNLRYAVKTLINPHIDQALAQKVIDTGLAPASNPPQPSESAPQPAKGAPQPAK
jgi:hypothetical protein